MEVARLMIFVNIQGLKAAQSLLSHQLASQSQSLGDLIIKEILAVNPDRLLDAKRTNELTIFFFVLFC